MGGSISDLCDNEAAYAEVVNEVCSDAKKFIQNIPLQTLCSSAVQGFLKDPCEKLDDDEGGYSNQLRSKYCKTVKDPSRMFCDYSVPNQTVTSANQFCSDILTTINKACPDPDPDRDAKVGAAFTIIGGFAVVIGSAASCHYLYTHAENDTEKKMIIGGATIFGGASVYAAIATSSAIVGSTVAVPAAFAVGASAAIVGASVAAGSLIGSKVSQCLSSFWNRKSYDSVNPAEPEARVYRV